MTEREEDSRRARAERQSDVANLVRTVAADHGATIQAAMTGRAQRAEVLVDAQKNLAALLGRPEAIERS
jgi:hypothetical protein